VLASRFGITDDRVQRAVDLLVRVWVIASIAIGAIVLVLRVATGPVEGAWLEAMVLIWTAPLSATLVYFAAGWVWFAAWLLAWPFKRLRGSRAVR